MKMKVGNVNGQQSYILYHTKTLSSLARTAHVTVLFCFIKKPMAPNKAFTL